MNKPSITLLRFHFYRIKRRLVAGGPYERRAADTRVNGVHNV